MLVIERRRCQGRPRRVEKFGLRRMIAELDTPDCVAIDPRIAIRVAGRWIDPPPSARDCLTRQASAATRISRRHAAGITRAGMFRRGPSLGAAIDDRSAGESARRAIFPLTDSDPLK